MHWRRVSLLAPFTLLKLEHKTKVQLNYKGLWAYFREQGVHGYINCKLCHLGGGIDSIKAYIYKGQAGGRPAVGEEGGWLLLTSC